MRNLNRWMLIFMIGVLSSCGSSYREQGTEQPNDSRNEIRLKQYMVQGKRLYQTHCSNCHQTDGSGFAKLYPPLVKSDYLLSDLNRAACIIKNGLEGEILVNNTSFNMQMPANEKLTPLEIAEILTYISNSWGNDAGITSTRNVEQWMGSCTKEKR